MYWMTEDGYGKLKEKTLPRE